MNCSCQGHSVSCPICFVLFDGNDIVATPCGHVFHSTCLFRWFDSSEACPECRNKVKRKHVIKLFLSSKGVNDNLLSNSVLQNELDKKETELKTMEKEFSFLKALQSYVQDSFVPLFEKNHQELRAAESSVKFHLKSIDKLEAKIQHLGKQNNQLKNQATQFSNIQTILQGNQHEAEELLREQRSFLSQEVGGQVAKNMAALCCILKRELLKLKRQKEEFKKREDELLHQLDISSDKIKKLLQTEADLKQLLKTANARPRSVYRGSEKGLPSSTEYNSNLQEQGTPVMLGGRQQTCISISAKGGESSKLTPISSQFSDKNRPATKRLVLLNGATATLSSANPSDLPFSKPVRTTFKRKIDADKDSSTHVGYNDLTHVGYNDLRGHKRVVLAKGERLTTKPYFKKS